MAFITGFDLAPELLSLFSKALKLGGTFAKPQITKNSTLLTRKQRNALLTNSQYYQFRAAWYALTDLERAAWKDLLFTHGLSAYAAFVLNNYGRQQAGMDLTTTPDAVPYICGHLHIPTTANHAAIEFVIDKPYYRYKGARSLISTKKLIHVDFTGRDPFDVFGWGHCKGYTHGTPIVSMDMECFDYSGGAFVSLGTIIGDMVIDSSGNFQTAGWEGDDFDQWYPTAARIVFRLIFSNVHGDFVIPKMLMGWPHRRDPDEVVPRDIYMRDIGATYPAALSKIKGGWRLGDHDAGVYLESIIPAAYGYTG